MVMRIWIYIGLLVLYQGWTQGYSTVQIWSRDTGGWGEKDCSATFVHYRLVQDVRLNHQLDEPCYCVFFTPDLDPESAQGMEVVYRVYDNGPWDLWRRSPYAGFGNNTYGFAEFGVNATRTGDVDDQSGVATVEIREGEIVYTQQLLSRVNIQVENGDVYLLCSPTGYIDPRNMVSTTTTTTEAPTTDSPNTFANSTQPPPAEENAKSSSKKKENDNNTLYYTIAGVVAGIGVLAFVAIVIVVMCRKQKVVEKRTGFIPHIMRQKSTFSQAQTLYSHNTWKGNPFSEQNVMDYDNDGIVAPEITTTSTTGSNNTKTAKSLIKQKQDGGGDSVANQNEAKVHVHHDDLYSTGERVDMTAGSDVDSGHGDSSLRDDSSSKKLVFHM